MKQLLVFLLVVGVVVAYWPWLVGLGALAAVVWYVCWRLEWAGQLRAARAQELEALAARADREHRWVMAGDDRGVYGMYPPAKMDGVNA